MVITCQGRALDLPQDMQITKSARAFRFSDTLASEWSTSATLPKTANNLSILGVADMLDGSDGAYKDPIPVIADIGASQTEGFVRVERYTESGVEVCFFFRTRADGDVGRKIYEILPDDADTVTTNGFDQTALPALATTPCGAACTGYGVSAYPAVFNPQPDIQLMSQLPAFTKVDGLLERLSVALGYSIEPTLSNLYIASVRRNAMPRNGRQVIRYAGTGVDGTGADGAVSPATIGGVCVCSDYDGGAADKITYNRRTRVTRAAMYVRSNIYTTWAKIEIKVNGVAALSVELTMQPLDTIFHYMPGSFSIPAGGELEVVVYTLSASTELQIILELDQEWDDTFASDWEREAGWIVQRGQGDYNTPEYNTIAPMLESRRQGQPVAFPSSYYYNYWGAMINLPDITLGEFLTSLGWYIGKKPVWDGWGWTWQTPNGKFAGEVILDSAEPYTDLLGKATFVGYREDGGRNTLAKDNGFLEEEKWAHKSAFSRPALSASGKMLDLALYDGTSWQGDKYAHIVHIEQDGGSLVTKQPRLPRLLGMDNAKPVKVSGRAIGDLSGCDYVCFASHEALIVESEWDADTGCSTFTALLCREEIKAKQLPFPVSIHALVPGASAQVITFYASDEQAYEVPSVDIITSDPQYDIYRVAVQEGENLIYLELPGRENTVTVADSLGTCEPWTAEVNAGEEKWAVAVECEYVKPDGEDLVFGFSAVGKTDGSAFEAYLYDPDGNLLQTEKDIRPTALPVTDYYTATSSATGIELRAKAPADSEFYTIEVLFVRNRDSFGGSVDIPNPYYIPQVS